MLELAKEEGLGQGRPVQTVCSQEELETDLMVRSHWWMLTTTELTLVPIFSHYKRSSKV